MTSGYFKLTRTMMETLLLCNKRVCRNLMIISASEKLFKGSSSVNVSRYRKYFSIKKWDNLESGIGGAGIVSCVTWAHNSLLPNICKRTNCWPNLTSYGIMHEGDIIVSSTFATHFPRSLSHSFLLFQFLLRSDTPKIPPYLFSY